MALAGMYGCSKRPKETIVPYVNQPEQMVPGEPLFFATALNHGGYGKGVIVTTREGRPIKIEGNPDHPASLGTADVWMQAAVLDLYDPARSKTVTRAGEPATWGNLVDALRDQLRLPNAGAGLRLLTGNVSSPTVLALIEAVLKKYPGSAWHAHEPLDRQNTRGGASLAFGRLVEPIYRFENARVIFSADSDFLMEEPGSLCYAGAFAAARRPDLDRPQMNRLYVAESTFSLTGTMADHRLPLRPSEVGALLLALAGRLAAGPAAPFADEAWLAALASDLKANAGASLVVVGDRQPPEAHAAAHRINQALGNFGKTIELIEPVVRGVGNGAGTLADLTADMAAGRVGTLLILENNPARTAPANVPFVAELAKLSTTHDTDARPRNLTVHLGLYADETAFNCQWHVPAQHALEAWSDIRAFDGTASIVQPQIAPLFDGRSPIDLLNALLGQETRSSYETVRATWASQPGSDATWSEALQRGTIGKPSPVLDVSKATSQVRAMPGIGLDGQSTPSTAPIDSNTLDAVFVPDASIWDGRYFHNAWLQELPRPLTKIVWGNAALLSPNTARAFGVADGDLIRLTAGDRSIELPALALPGLPDNVINLPLGYGRHQLCNTPVEPSGGPGTEFFGVDVYPLRTSPHVVSGVRIEKTGRHEKIVRTHAHHAMASQKGSDPSVSEFLTPVVIATPDASEEELKLHNRKIIRTATLAQFQQKPTFAQDMDEKHLLSLYTPWDYSQGPQWGMTIDISTCIGCNACTIACQAENNIPVVGPDQVDREREMHWIRVDNYFGGSDKSPAVYHQPVPCMHCENAPCEYVCPVAATSHSTDGLNQMTYNRCVGTRYCSNNCPYKVRRFNFYNYTVDTPASVALRNNPDVTVRTLGVMEKCSYCVQRIIYTKRKSEIASLDVKLKQGEAAALKVSSDMVNRLQTACQQTCPTGAIVFGDISNAGSSVSKSKSSPRNYSLLAELTTKPRTTYLAHLGNPNENAGGGA